MEHLFDRTRLLLVDSASTAYEKLVLILPNALLALLIILIGWVIATIAYHLCVRILQFFAVDKLAAKTPLHAMLRSAGVSRGPSDILGLLVFSLVILATFVFASELLELPQVSAVLALIASYIPNVIAACIVVFAGMLVAKFVQTIAVQAMLNAGTGHEREIGKVVQGVVLVFVFLVAFGQLGFELSLLTTNASIVVSVLLALVGIAIILSARTTLENAFVCRQLQKMISVGSTVDVDGHSGVVESFTSTSVVLSRDGKRIVLPASVFMQSVYTLR